MKVTFSYVFVILVVLCSMIKTFSHHEPRVEPIAMEDMFLKSTPMAEQTAQQRALMQPMPKAPVNPALAIQRIRKKGPEAKRVVDDVMYALAREIPGNYPASKSAEVTLQKNWERFMQLMDQDQKEQARLARMRSRVPAEMQE